MTALLIGKVLLVVFLVAGCAALTITYVRRRRAGVKPWTNPEASPYLDLYRGGLSPTPPPPPAHDRAAGEDPPARGDGEGSARPAR
uniref:hypothetical protein n=1 Tax=Mycobacterium avium TaxID=1764 RepID=UPI0009FB9733|nr:hypothetical protein [Mycobacterium avium]